MSKKTVAALFGGRSSKHEISCLSVANITHSTDHGTYDLVLVGIMKGGHWIKVNRVEDIEDDSWRRPKAGAMLPPDATERCLMIHKRAMITRVRIDPVFPVLHGLYGEDGTTQGLRKLVRTPFAGCGTTTSVIGTDKGVAKPVVHSLDIRQADFPLVTSQELKDMCAIVDRAEDRFSYPVFVKPCNAGLSCGVTKMHKREEFAEAPHETACFDSRILIKEYTVRYEIECAVLGGGARPVQASDVGEILVAADFYGYGTKYYSAESKTIVDPELPGGNAGEVCQSAIHVFNTLNGYSLSRADFFVVAVGEVIFDKINTMPGFTAISMYPMFFAARGRDKKTLVREFMGPAFEKET